MKKGTSPSALSDSFCRIPSANAVSADASAAMNLYALCRALAQRCPWICIGPCTLLSTSLIERAKKHIILPFPPAFICFRKTWIPHFRRCSRMRMQCFTRRNRNEIRMLRKFYQIGIDFFRKAVRILEGWFLNPVFQAKQTGKNGCLIKKFLKKGRWTEWIVVILMGEVPA